MQFVLVVALFFRRKIRKFPLTLSPKKYSACERLVKFKHLKMLIVITFCVCHKRDKLTQNRSTSEKR